jgi:arylsulfatase A-like enzyme
VSPPQGGPGGGGAPGEQGGGRPNLLVVMTDSLRPDYVGAYRRATDGAGLPGQLSSPAGTGARTPYLDRFGAEGTVFERAYAASFPTVPNRNDLHTGRFTFPHRGWSPLPPDVPCLAAVLTRAGYVSQFYCDTPNQVPMGLHRGFGGWEWHRGQEGDRFGSDPRLHPDPGCPPEKLRGNGAPYRQYLRNRARWESEEDHFAPRTLRSGMAWLQQYHEARRAAQLAAPEGGGAPDGAPDGAPFFLWLDTFDPHEPWDAPPYYVDWYDPGYRGQVLPHAAYGRADYMTEAERQHTKALYAAEVSMVDKWIGRLLQQVDDLGYRDTTAVLHLSDHGHYFGDHGLQGKPYQEPELLMLYEGLIRTALTVRLPGGRGAGRRTGALAQPPDVTATLLDLAGLGQAALPGAQGRSLLPAIDGAAEGPQAVYTSRYPILEGRVSPCAVTSAEWSYQYWPGAPEQERLYHLPSDPGQERDLRAERPQVARDLRALYLDWLRGQTPELCGWLERIEREPGFRPDSPALFRGAL